MYLKTPHLNNFSRILCFILIGEKIAFIILVIASIAFQRVLIIRIKRNDYIPFRCRAITLNLRVWVTPSHDSRHSAASARLRVTFCGLAGYRPIPRSTKVRPAYRVSNMPTKTARNGKSPVPRSIRSTGLSYVSFQIFLKERFQLLKWDHVYLIVKVGVVCAGDNEQFLIVAGQLALSCLTEIARVRLFPVYQQYGTANLAAVLQNRHI